MMSYQLGPDDSNDSKSLEHHSANMSNQTLDSVLRRALDGDVEGSLNAIARLTPFDASQDAEICRVSQRLRAARSFDVAEALVQRFANADHNHWLMRELAHIDLDRGARESSHHRFGLFLERFPESSIAHCDYMTSLMVNLGKFDKAERFGALATLTFPNDLWVGHAYATCAEKNRDWQNALARWASVCATHPLHKPAVEGVVRAGFHLQLLSNSNTCSALGAAVPCNATAITDLEFRAPVDLAVTPSALRNVLVLGSCLISGLEEIIADVGPVCEVDTFTINNFVELPETPPRPADQYDFQIVQIALTTVLPEGAYINLEYDRPDEFTQLFVSTRERLSQVLKSMLKWNQQHGLLSFVSNFVVPQQNLMGRLLPRYDLRNLAYFIERLNIALAEALSVYQNAYLFDFDQIVATYGRRHYQDDVLCRTNHGAGLTDWDFAFDQARIEIIGPVSEIYPTRVSHFLACAWRELVALYRTIRQTDMVKLVLVDLDDTLWRGVVAEEEEVSFSVREGWPVGFVEALRYLKWRGVMLGIVSKNDEKTALRSLHKIYGDLLTLDGIAVHRINWRQKVDNIQDILTELNLLPTSVIFIDDNPVERAAVKAAFPDMRVLGANPYLLRRILLWAPETQVATITTESSARTKMAQRQVEREHQRKQISRTDFLLGLDLRVELFEICDLASPHFARTIELVNKTNQFNTTGKRWTVQELHAVFVGGGSVYAFNVKDRFTNYGLVGVLIVDGSEILQMVMSCRVIGMDVELAAVAGVLRLFAQRGIEVATARLVETGPNLPCRDLWKRCGFTVGPEGFTRALGAAVEAPTHVSLTVHTADGVL